MAGAWGYIFGGGVLTPTIAWDFLRTVNMAWDELLDEKELSKKAPDFFQQNEEV